MYNSKQKLESKRQVLRKSLPQINLRTCRVERSKDKDIQRIIIEGNPVLLGAILPNIEVGGLVPFKMMSSADGKLAVGIVKGIPKNRDALIDYGFTRDQCKIEETSFTEKDAAVFQKIIQIPIRKVKRNKLWRKIRIILAKYLLRRKK